MKILLFLMFMMFGGLAYAGSHDDVHANLLRKFGNNVATTIGDGRAKVGFFEPHYLLMIDTQNAYFYRGTRKQRLEWLAQYLSLIHI